MIYEIRILRGYLFFACKNITSIRNFSLVSYFFFFFLFLARFWICLLQRAATKQKYENDNVPVICQDISKVEFLLESETGSSPNEREKKKVTDTHDVLFFNVKSFREFFDEDAHEWIPYSCCVS